MRLSWISIIYVLTPCLFRAKVKKSNATKRNSRISNVFREPLGGAKRLHDRFELASEQRAEPHLLRHPFIIPGINHTGDA